MDIGVLGTRSRFNVLGLAALTMCLSYAPFARADEQACHGLLGAGTDTVRIDDAQFLRSAKMSTDVMSAMTGASFSDAALPPHCLVRGVIEPRNGADGKRYGVQFELRLPDDWTQRLLFQGGGGMDGFLAQAVGSVPVRGSSAMPALLRRYAVVSMDGGHQGMDASFAKDQQARVDLAYAAIGKVTTQAKRLIARYYQPKLMHSYFMGCSNGGREAMIAAQRYPTEFDGVVAGNPGFRLSRAALATSWDTQALMSVAPKDDSGRPVLAKAFSREDLKLLGDRVVKDCDALDGVKDGLVNDYRSCRFDPKGLQCSAGKQQNCLSQSQVKALHKVFDGPKDSKGLALYSTWPYDSGISAEGWRSWKLGTSDDASNPNALNIVLGAESLGGYFMTPPRAGFDTLNFNFDADVPLLAQTGALNDATSTFMPTFEGRGGKMIIFHGLSDPVFSAHDIMRWYDETRRDTSAGDAQRMEQWARLFLAPGMTHCGGGPALDDFDPLTAIENWVERGQAPAFLAAKGQSFPGKEQPLCPYPQVARYRDGDVNDVKSYVCSSGPGS